MTGRAYYLTTLADWQRHAARFANSHFVVLGTGNTAADTASYAAGTAGNPAIPGAGIRILALIEADEGVHISIENDPAFESLPHPLAQKPISQGAQAALVAHGVAPGATTFDAAEAVGRLHPLLRHRVF
jgi:hypothetical protein